MSVTDFKNALRDTDELALTVTNGAGRETTRPVWFVQDGDILYLLPVKGSNTKWFESVAKTPTMRLTANDVTASATARPIGEPQRVRDVVEKFRAKYGADEVRKYYSKFDVAVEVPLT
jgi:hypothetical protein